MLQKSKYHKWEIRVKYSNFPFAFGYALLLGAYDNNIQMIDFKIVDINGQYRHVTIPAEQFSEETLTDGIGFDASNYGYAVVEKSDMVFIPDLETAMIDPFCGIPT